MFKITKCKIFIALIFIFIIIFVNFNYIYNYFFYAMYDQNNLRINSELINSHIHSVASDPSNRVYIKTVVRNYQGRVMPNAKVTLNVDNGVGELYPSYGVTNKYGEFISAYVPPHSHNVNFNTQSDIIIRTKIKNSNNYCHLNLKLIPVPVVFVHGYQETSFMFDNMNEFLSHKGYISSAIDFDSSAGVIYAANELKDFLQEKKYNLLNNGILVSKFSLISHSMGGLAVRYYTSSEDYIKNNDVYKTIFLSVPHRGSHLASIGENYFNDQSIKDLIPNNELFLTTFYSMINNGLNNSIMTGNILSQYDEVVTSESASLDYWNIKTEIFNVGENKFTMNNLLDGSLLEAPNHKGILNNKKVFERIYEMLNEDLPYPSMKNKTLLRPIPTK
ncbi:UNVERIFIED_CONTAM: hypothetical protein Cloal_1112 [Acetivibrio alkalicellulosi]